jgi:S-adenosylmethionine uptake transporter
MRAVITAPLEQPQKAITLMILGMLILPGMDAIAKWLSSSISTGQVVCYRFLLQALFLLPFFWSVRGRIPLTDIPLHVARGALMIVGTFAFFTALKYLPIADAIAIFFVAPLILTLLATLFLGEKIGWRRLLAIIVGFAGALIVIRPNFEVFGWPALLPLVAAAAFSVYLILTRRLSQRETPIRMQFFSGLFGGLIATLALGFGDRIGWPLFATVAPTQFEWFLLFALALISTVGHLLVVHAFQRAPAGLLAPFQYTEIIGATLLGVLFFGDFPDALTWLGVGIIVGSGLYVFHRERAISARSESVT